MARRRSRPGRINPPQVEANLDPVQVGLDGVDPGLTHRARLGVGSLVAPEPGARHLDPGRAVPLPDDLTADDADVAADGRGSSSTGLSGSSGIDVAPRWANPGGGRSSCLGVIARSDPRGRSCTAVPALLVEARIGLIRDRTRLSGRSTLRDGQEAFGIRDT